MRFAPRSSRPGPLARLCLTATMLSGLTIAPYTAQALPASPSPADKAQDPTTEVIVTALKRATPLQHTPLSISVVTGTQLGVAGITDVTAIKGVPGLTFVDGGPSNTRFVIRGVQTVGEPTVGVYYDETPVTGLVSTSNDAGGSMPLFKLFDVDRVEILRGPQGTLYGSGSMGGAFRVIFNKPSMAYSAEVDADGSAANHGGSGGAVEGMVNLPVIQDRLAVRAVAFDQQTPGVVDNVTFGLKDVDSQHMRGGRLMARLTPSDTFVLDGSLFYQKTTGDRPVWYEEAGAYTAINRARFPNSDENLLFNLTGKLNLTWATLTGVGTYDDRNLRTAQMDPSAFFQTDINNPALCAKLRGNGSACTPDMQTAFNTYVSQFIPAVIQTDEQAHDTSFELRLNSNSDSVLAWTTGVFYNDRVEHVVNRQFEVDGTTGDVIVPQINETERDIDDDLKQEAVFGEVTWSPIADLHITAGTRYFSYQRTVGGQTPVPLDLVNAKLTPYTVVSSKENSWVSKLNLSYDWTKSVMVYAQAAQGFRPGGVNQVIGLPATLGPYQSDSLWDYEAGIKTRSFSDRLTLNADLFRIDWSDMQVQGMTTSGPFSFISNAGAARIDGAEIEASLKVSPDFLVTASYSAQNARLTENQANANIIANGIKGDRIPYVPETTESAGANYHWAIGGNLQGTAQLSATYVGESFSEFRPTNIYYRKLPAYTLVSGRIGIGNPGRGWEIELYGDNLLDQIAITSSTSNAILGGKTFVASAAPRTFGVHLQKRF